MSSEGENTHTPAAGTEDAKLPVSQLLSLLPLVVALSDPFVTAAPAAEEESSRMAREKPSVAAAAAVAGCGDCPTQ